LLLGPLFESVAGVEGIGGLLLCRGRLFLGLPALLGPFRGQGPIVKGGVAVS
jgi:hypothetical protein